jgi:tetratricopeptide (TPR) repeat protein
MRNAFHGAVQEALRGAQENYYIEWGNLTKLSALMADAACAEEVETAANVALDDIEAKLRARTHSTDFLKEFNWGIDSFSPALRERAINLAVTHMSHPRDYVFSMARDAVHFGESLGQEVLALDLLDAAITLMEQLPGNLEHAEAATEISLSLFILGRNEQAQAHLDEALEIARGFDQRDRLSLLRYAMHNIGHRGGLRAIEAIINRTSNPDLEQLGERFALSLGVLGCIDEARQLQRDLTHGSRRIFQAQLVNGLMQGGHASEALTEYSAIDDAEARESLVPTAVQAHAARGQVAEALRLVAMSPMNQSLHFALHNLYTNSDDDQAVTVFTLSLANGRVSCLGDLAERFPQALVANTDVIQAIFPVDAASPS